MSNRKQAEEKMTQAGRLPPGQVLTQKLPVLHEGPIPPFTPATWDFRVWGEVEQEIVWDWAAFQNLPRVKITMDIHCVTRWSKFDTVWEGVSVQALIEAGLLRPSPAARFVVQHAEYGYTTNLPLDVVLQENFLLAMYYDGQPLTPEHGYPLRAVIGDIPGSDLKTPYFWKGAKWLRGLEFLAEDQPGYWERVGYHNFGDVWREDRFQR